MSTLNNEEQIEQAEIEAENPPAQEPVSSKELTIRVPASAANLGPAFDTVALAVQLYVTLTISIQAPDKSGNPKIITSGPIARELPTDHTNHISRVIRKLWPQDPKAVACLKITIDTEIPLGKGLGSSAAATVAAATGVLALCGVPLQKGNIYAQCAEIEGYASSVCASTFGGFTICGPGTTPEDILARKIIWPDNWAVLAMIPPYTVGSKKTRGVLPTSLSFKDAIFNVQRTALLIEAVAAGDNEAMRIALRDKMHEPYQTKFVPEFSEIKKVLHDSDVLGTVLSAGGPSIISIVDLEQKDSALAGVNAWNTSQKHPWQILELPIDTEGLVVTCE